MILLSAVSLATNFQFFTVFLLCQLTFYTAYKFFSVGYNSKIPWILLLIVCLTYIWDTDYYSYMQDYMNGMAISGEKEKLYYFLYELTNPYYLLWRFLIWGTAICLYHHTCKRLEIQPYIGIYVLIIFFLTLFAYGRVNLAMALYYFGFSFILKPGKNKFYSVVLGACVLSSSFFAHRSFLPIIVLTPLFFIPLSKKKLLMLIVFVPVITLLINNVFSSFLNNSIQMDSTFESFQNSAERIVNSEFEERNWKSLTMIALRNYSLYIPVLYLLYKVYYQKSKQVNLDKCIQPLLTAVSVIVILSLCLQYGVDGVDTATMAKRYLFISGIGECLLLSYLYNKGQISKNILNKLILLGFLCMEANFFFTYLTHGYTIVHN